MTAYSYPSSAAGCLVALLATVRLCAAGPTPALQWDPATISPCIMWEDNAGDLVCEEVREYWNITPEQFSKWNPSVGLDCKPWGSQSYCVVPEVRLIEDPRPSLTTKPTTTTVAASSSTTSTSGLGPSPTSWKAMGCYADPNEALPVLEKLISKESGDAALTIAKCKDSCYKASLVFAGLKAGNQCWCSSFVGGEWANNVTECSTPCTGNKDEDCGGNDAVNVFGALESDDDADDENEPQEEKDGKDQKEDQKKDEEEDPKDKEEESAPAGGAVSSEPPSSGAMRLRTWF